MTSRSSLADIIDDQTWDEPRRKPMTAARQDRERIKIGRMLLAAAAEHDAEQARMRGETPRIEVVR